ncbi:MAG: hypothetical protein SFW35_12265 [Chitinophagales bacterium]|nr:hypothetical protein [Chitinophagales bacterium]
MSEWKKVYSSMILTNAEIVRTMLVDNEIDAVVVNKQSSAYPQIGQAEVHVPIDMVLPALNLINRVEDALAQSDEEE